MILLDECVQRAIGVGLTEAGIPYVAAAEFGAGIQDPLVLQLALERRLVLVTRDKDFGDLIYRDGLSAYGVILYRLPNAPLADVVHQLVSFILVNRNQLAGNFTVIDSTGTRSRPLKRSKGEAG